MLDEKTILRVVAGSHLFGTATPSSDIDYKEVYIPSGRSILLNRVKEGRASGPDKLATEKNKPGDIDTQSFAVTKLFKMLIGGDIIGWEMIFVPDRNVIYRHPWFDEIIGKKDIFLCRNVSGYVGYCRQQANKYGIRGSRIAAVRGLLEILTLSYASGHKKLEEIWPLVSVYCSETDHSTVLDIPNGNDGQPIPHIECCGKKQPIGKSIKEAIDCYQKVFDEYGHRALLAEKNEGIDWKAMSHAVRVGEQAVELLKTGSITLPRQNADYLIEVKTGLRPYKEVADHLDRLLLDVEKLQTITHLPEKPDLEAIDEFIVDLHRRMLT